MVHHNSGLRLMKKYAICCHLPTVYWLTRAWICEPRSKFCSFMHWSETAQVCSYLRNTRVTSACGNSKFLSPSVLSNWLFTWAMCDLHFRLNRKNWEILEKRAYRRSTALKWRGEWMDRKALFIDLLYFRNYSLSSGCCVIAPCRASNSASKLFLAPCGCLTRLYRLFFKLSLRSGIYPAVRIMLF